MRYLGLDLGTRTLGVAISDKNLIIATPYKTIRHDNDLDYLILELEKIIKEEEISKIILGYPKNMNNTIGEKAIICNNFKDLIENKLNIKVILQDERLSTIEAEKVLINNKNRRDKRKKVIDSVAESIILNTYLERSKL